MLTRAFVVLSLMSACAGDPPITPATLPADPTTYTDPGTGRSFSAPAGGKLIVEKFGNGVAYGDDETGVALAVRALPSPLTLGASESDLDGVMRETAQRESTARVSPMMKEVASTMTVRCFEISPHSNGGPRKKGAACFSTAPDDATMVLALVIGGAERYGAMGGARVAADAARSAKGFTTR
jgi:hypothetical protein